MKFSKNQWISILKIIVPVVVGLFVYNSWTKVTVTGNDNATAVGDHAQATVNKFVDPPASFKSTSTLTQNPDNSYSAIIKIVADKDYNLPSLLCVSIQSDVKFKPEGRISMRNDGSNSGNLSQDSGHTCLRQPSSHVIAYFRLESKPSTFKVILATTTPTS